MLQPNRKFMKLAIEQAKKALKSNQYPIGAVIIKDDKIITRGFTKIVGSTDVTKHAEINVIRKAGKKLGDKYLEECVLYTTCEPCSMCSSAAVWSKLEGIVFGINSKDCINLGWRTIMISCEEVLLKGKPRIELCKNFMREECLKIASKYRK